MWHYRKSFLIELLNRSGVRYRLLPLLKRKEYLRYTDRVCYTLIDTMCTVPDGRIKGAGKVGKTNYELYLLIDDTFMVNVQKCITQWLRDRDSILARFPELVCYPTLMGVLTDRKVYSVEDLKLLDISAIGKRDLSTAGFCVLKKLQDRAKKFSGSK